MASNQIFARKSLEVLLKEMEGDNRLRRVLGPMSLTSLGVGAIIGAGIFALTGRAAAQDAGPAIIISFIVAGIGCALAAMCYAELAAMVPVAGSAYTYAYATLGELFAWIIGWDLILEYAMGCSTVAAAWSGHFREFINISMQFNLSLINFVLVMMAVGAVLEVLRRWARLSVWLILMVQAFVITVGVMAYNKWQLPSWLLTDPFTASRNQGWAIFNLPAVVIMLIVTSILVVGIRESAGTNNVLVVMKLVVVVFVIVIGLGYVVSTNWTGVPVEDRIVTQDAADKWGMLGLLGINQWLLPVDEATRMPFSPYGFSGIMVGAAIVFFAYIGFDAISTHAEEAIHPQRDVPIAIIASLAICTVLYIAVAIVITGMVPYPKISIDSAIATAFRELAEREASPLLRVAAFLIAIGALAGMTSVLLVTFLSQARIFLAMARDGLLPQSIFGDVHPKFRTPHKATILTGIFICVAAAFTPIDDLGDMVSIGTLMAFVIVCVAVLILRKTRPDAARPFRCPWVGVIATTGAALNLFMMLFLSWKTWLRLLVWLIVGLMIYYFYGRHRSAFAPRLEQEIAKPGLPETGTRLDDMHRP